MEFIEFVADGRELIPYLDAIDNESELPRLIVLDLFLPVMDGKSVLEQLKSTNRYKSIPVIVLSNSRNPGNKEECLKLGAHSYYTKPLDSEEFKLLARKFYDFSLQ